MSFGNVNGINHIQKKVLPLMLWTIVTLRVAKAKSKGLLQIIAHCVITVAIDLSTTFPFVAQRKFCSR